jgi:copper resistance protein C
MTAHAPFRRSLAAAAMAVLLAFAGLVGAHSSATSSTPEDGVHLDASPETVGIEFDGQMRITRFLLIGPDGPVNLQDRPGPQPARGFHTSPSQPLAPGAYRVEWRGLAADGHVMSGSFRFRVGD